MATLDRRAGQVPPRFAILVPSYNRPKFLARTLDSILKSRWQDYELIVSDDNSPNKEVLELAVAPYCSDPRVTYYRQSGNLREPGNKNFLVAKATADFNLIVGDDDLLHADALEYLDSTIPRYPGVELLLFGYDVIDNRGSTIARRVAPAALRVGVRQPRLLRQLLLFDVFPFWFCHPATFCCRHGLEQEFPYSADVGIGEDFLFLLEYLNSGRDLVVLPRSLFSWRRMASSTEQHNQSLNAWANVDARARIWSYIRQRMELHPVVEEIVNEPRFVRRFLFDAVVSDASWPQNLPADLPWDRETDISYRRYSSRGRLLHKLGVRLAARLWRLVLVFRLRAVTIILSKILWRVRRGSVPK